MLDLRDAADIAASCDDEFRERLLAWFRRHRRDLPWRRTSDPYRIWLSEIMLQQTRVAAVIPYYERFLDRFPTIESLAAAPEEEVLRMWSGLGYYSRARNLQRAARTIVSEHGAVFPQTEDEALALPGIGNYTAAAILSIAFGEKLAVLDGNVARVLARIGAVGGDLREPQRWRALQKSAEELLDGNAPGDWNQAMMELGATLCTPHAPQCLLCPVAEFCRARQLGIADTLPQKRAKPSTVDVTLAVAIFLDARGRTLLLPPPQRAIGKTRPAKSLQPTTESDVLPLVSRMWHFPTVVAGDDPRRNLLHCIEENFAAAFLGKSPADFPPKHSSSNGHTRPAKTSHTDFALEPLPPARHTVTYRRIELRPFLIRVRRLPKITGSKAMRLADVCGPVSLAISNLTRKCARSAAMFVENTSTAASHDSSAPRSIFLT